jgi:NADH:ubiquinone oxidoreductase subunit D
MEAAKGLTNSAFILLSTILYRFRISSIGAILASSLPDIISGSEMQDLIVLIGTIDLVLGEVDR